MIHVPKKSIYLIVFYCKEHLMHITSTVKSSEEPK